ncbi:related to hsp70 protein [Phialocephala subalpina]|uniref:Related to hsp70 protein n=1 Tax=Phialocephala subalpina TaxID=576137 RepID=A0A1L7X117_9HELO|nr:related to hsp70 protein [Phialocephala subalpina]
MTDDHENLPDFVIGVDFGQTYTGVVWTNLGNTNPTQSIQEWPGLPADSIESKVPTRIAYPRDGSEPIWGFLCDSDDHVHEVAEVREHFKVYLDQDSLDSAKSKGVRNMPETVDEAMRLVRDYLHQVYLHIKLSLEAATGSWKDRRIEFVFSLPTTWTSLDTTNRFNNAIRAAGFMSEPKHTAKLELTEAEAAAVYMVTIPQVSMKQNDIILICDAGGGTTDLGLIEIMDADPNKPSLKQVAAVKGIGIGSTMIDRAFEILVQNRLDIHHETHSLPEDLAHKLAKSSSFQIIKHNFGTRAASQQLYKLPLHTLGLGINPDYTHLGLNIEGGKMVFARAEIQALFDRQIQGIIVQIGKQLDWMQIHRHGDHVKLLVLSGGLGGSQYVMTKIQERFTANPHPSAPHLKILKSQEPRLVVVKGLVIDRRQQLVAGTAALRTRIARASYGVLCRQLYDPSVHVGAKVEIDHLNKKQKWATMQIDWIIKKAKTAKERKFSRKVVPGDPNRKWNTTIVISHEDRKNLPMTFKQPTVWKLCQLSSDLKEVAEEEFEVRNKRVWQGKRYYLATFAVKVIIAPADLKFELWFNGTRYNRGHDPISIEWDPAGAGARPRTSDDLSDEWESSVHLTGRLR